MLGKRASSLATNLAPCDADRRVPPWPGPAVRFGGGVTSELRLPAVKAYFRKTRDQPGPVSFGPSCFFFLEVGSAQLYFAQP